MLDKLNFENIISNQAKENLKKTQENIKNAQENDLKLKDLSENFEAIFVKQMLDSMRKTLNKDNNILNGGLSEDIFSDMLYNEIAIKTSQSRSLGISKLLYEQLREKRS